MVYALTTMHPKFKMNPISKLLPLLLAFLLLSCASKNFYATSPLYQPMPSETPDSVLVQAGKHYRRNGVYSFVFGKHYRDVWAAPVQVKVLRLQEEKDGLVIKKTGGSKQTFSLTLEDKRGVTYALRSVDKDPSGTLSPLLRKTWAANFIRDQTAAINPYAALVVAPLAESVGIPQSNPSLYYLPANDAALGGFREEAGDRLYLMEEKFDEATLQLSGEENVRDVVSTKKMLQKRYAKQGHIINELEFAKARLFDLYINDRDRHEGQWSWAAYKKNGKSWYYPLPKDRDQAFYKFAHGVIPKLVGQGLNFQKFKSFDGDYANLHALIYKSIGLDTQMLTGVTAAQFDSLALNMQEALSDDVIVAAVHHFPEAAYQIVGESTIQKLQSRRNLLRAVAKEYYLLLAKEGAVIGTDAEEYFQVRRLDDERTEVVVSAVSDGEVMFRRIFHRAETKEIRLYGLNGNDTFEIEGTVNKGLTIRVIGGDGADTYGNDSNVKAFGKQAVLYDTKPDTETGKGPDTKMKAARKAKTFAFKRNE